MSETLDINRSEEIRAGVIPEVRSVDHIGRALGGLFALIRFPVSEVERVQGVSLRDTDVPNLRASPLTREEFRAMALGDLVQHPRVNKNPGHLLLRTLQILKPYLPIISPTSLGLLLQVEVLSIHFFGTQLLRQPPEALLGGG